MVRSVRVRVELVPVACITCLLLALPFAAAAQVRLPPSDSAYLLEPGRVGPFAVGITIDELHELIGVQRLTLVDDFGEGVFTPTVHLELEGGPEGPDLVGHLDKLQCERFWKWYLPRLEVRDERFRTRDGVGVGSTFEEVREGRWVTADGYPAPRAFHHETSRFPVLRFVFEGRERECEACGPPDDEDRVVAVALAEPYPPLRERRCGELLPGPRGMRDGGAERDFPGVGAREPSWWPTGELTHGDSRGDRGHMPDSP